MQIRRILVAFFVAAAVGGSGAVMAASKTQAKEPSTNMPGMGQMGMDQGMMRGGMMQGEMMGMMNECKEMMSSSTMPRLPPGNTKLELQMRAEMMQKMGEILAKYADRISADKGSAQ
jgi:hypothetical protein